MTTYQIQFEQWVPAAIEHVFLFFANPRNLPSIMPPETRTELVHLKLVPPPASALEGTTVDRNLLAGPAPRL